MNSVRGSLGRVVAAVACAALAACTHGSSGERAARSASSAHHRAAPAESAPAATAADWNALRVRIRARADSADRALRRVPALTGAEEAALRRDINDVQTARARALGIRPGSDVQALVASGQLVPLADSTRYWVLHDLRQSVPYVTPHAEAMLAEIGERFQAKLDSLGLPPYRLVVTSVLRTPETQRMLRRVNANAAEGTSSHEYGTTLDVAYRRFAAPPSSAAALDGVPPELAPPARQLQDSLLIAASRRRTEQLQAVLGRVLREMRQEGKLMVMMERRQTVYHTTVARRLERVARVPAE